MISVSLVCAELSNRAQLDYIYKHCDYIHFDIMDIGYSSCNALTIPQLDLLYVDPRKTDVHISSVHPEEYINQCIEKRCQMICFPVDSQCDIEHYLRKIKTADLLAGLAIKPDISLDAILPYLPVIDYVNVMTVYPGPPGQTFQVRELNKIICLRQIRASQNHSFLIELDGSCNPTHFHEIYNAQPDICVVGKSGLFDLDSNITIAWKKMEQYMCKKEKVYLHADLVGSPLKDSIKAYLSENNYDYIDLYTDGGEEYLECAKRLCDYIKMDEYNIGILVCGTGIGMSIAANKIPGIRAAVVSDVFSAKAAKEHNNANVLCIGSRVLTEQLARLVVDSFLSNHFLHGKHQNRVDRIDNWFETEIRGNEI